MHTPTTVACRVAEIEQRKWLSREMTAEELEQSKFCRAFRSRASQVLLQGDSCDGCARNPWGTAE